MSPIFLAPLWFAEQAAFFDIVLMWYKSSTGGGCTPVRRLVFQLTGLPKDN